MSNITKIKIKNLFGIREYEADGSSLELSGKNGTGKSSVLDAIKYALTNKSDRDYIVHKGENEGEIIVETDTKKSDGTCSSLSVSHEIINQKNIVIL